MVKEQVVKERELIDGVWVATEKNLNDPDNNPLEFETLVMKTPNGTLFKFSMLDDGVMVIEADNGEKYHALLKGINYQTGVVVFKNTKNMIVTFPRQFKKRPQVKISAVENNATLVYRVYATKSKAYIRLKNKFTGEIEWTATERE